MLTPECWRGVAELTAEATEELAQAEARHSAALADERAAVESLEAQRQAHESVRQPAGVVGDTAGDPELAYLCLRLRTSRVSRVSPSSSQAAQELQSQAASAEQAEAALRTEREARAAAESGQGELRRQLAELGAARQAALDGQSAAALRAEAVEQTLTTVEVCALAGRGVGV
eukprot:SAG25_NODE_118_length_14760_cov_873.663666_25_plen_173_part_00